MGSARSTDVVVVGAGLSGLAATRNLTAQGLEVVVLEARERVGGRVRSETFADGTLVESGGQWVGPTQDAVLALLDDLGIGRYPTPHEGTHRVGVGRAATDFTGETYGLSTTVLIEAGIVQRRLERMAATVPLEAPWVCPHADRWDALTVAAWLGRNTLQPGTRDFFRVVTTALFCAEPSQLSLLHFLFYCRSGGMLDRLLSTRDGAQQWRIAGGAQGVARRVADDLGDRVVLDAPVRAMTQDGEGVTVVSDGVVVEGAAAVVAVPPHLVGRIEFLPALPSRRVSLTQSVPMGSVIKAHARYERPFWRDLGRSGFALSMDHDLSVVFDNTPPGTDSGVLVGFFEGAAAKRVTALTTEQRGSIFATSMADLFGPHASEPIEYVDRDWTAERWSGGCYGGHLGPGVWTHLGEEMRRPFGRIRWAGTETATTWNGYMDGAITAGHRAAAEVVSMLDAATLAST